MPEDLLPRDASEWHISAAQHGVLDKTIFQIAPWSSLDFNRAAFLALRVLCPREKQRADLELDNEVYRWVTADTLRQARNLLHASSDWADHLQSISAPWRRNEEGSFGTARVVRALISEEESWGSCTPKVVFPPLNNEELAHDMGRSSMELYVSSALNGYLAALTAGQDEVKGKWVARQRLTMRQVNGRPVMMAYINGCLCRRSAQEGNTWDVEEILAIADAHNVCRRALAYTHLGIQMQEGAQFAAWVAQYPPRPEDCDAEGLFRRLKVSQNHLEIYLTIATFDMGYVDYVCAQNMEHSTAIAPSFLEMQEYGPFSLTDLGDATFLGEFLLAFSIQGGLKGKEPESSRETDEEEQVRFRLGQQWAVGEDRIVMDAADMEFLKGMSSRPLAVKARFRSESI